MIPVLLSVLYAAKDKLNYRRGQGGNVIVGEVILVRGRTRIKFQFHWKLASCGKQSPEGAQ
ncbi:hypothetical protein QF001_001752 [Paraburkholderia youngii]